ncbi:MAG: hypothetical protein ACRC2T_07490, partial [Thermoguttaceae bacterium]
YPLGTLKAGEEKVIPISTVASQQDDLNIAVSASGPFGLQAEASRNVKVLRPNLAAVIEGDEMQFVENETEYKIVIQNHGTAAANNVEIKAMIPPGAKYVSHQGNGGVAPGKQNLVVWNVETIPAGQEYVCTLVCEMKREGACKLDVQTYETTKKGERVGNVASQSIVTNVNAIADLILQIDNPQGPVEIGKTAVYTINVTNRGTKSAENVDVVAAFSDGVVPIGIEDRGVSATISDTSDERNAGQVFFDTIPVIGPKQKVTLKIKAKGVVSGSHKIRVEMVCDATETYLVNEDTTRYYDKQSGKPSEQRVATSNKLAVRDGSNRSTGNRSTNAQGADKNSTKTPSRSANVEHGVTPKTTAPTPVPPRAVKQNADKLSVELPTSGELQYLESDTAGIEGFPDDFNYDFEN